MTSLGKRNMSLLTETEPVYKRLQKENPSYKDEYKFIGISEKELKLSTT
jgi:hypothetical protein